MTTHYSDIVRYYRHGHLVRSIGEKPSPKLKNDPGLGSTLTVLDWYCLALTDDQGPVDRPKGIYSLTTFYFLSPRGRNIHVHVSQKGSYFFVLNLYFIKFLIYEVWICLTQDTISQWLHQAIFLNTDFQLFDLKRSYFTLNI